MIGDLRYTFRSLTRRPGLTIAAVTMLAIGIAANTIVFTLVNTLALRPMPVPEASRVVRIYPIDASGRRDNLFSYRDYVDYRAGAVGFDALAAYIPADVTLGRWSRDQGAAPPRQALVYVASPEYFSITGVQPVLGRILQASDEASSSARVAVISHALWQSRFGSDPSIVGTNIVLNAHDFTVVGVAGAEFMGTEPLVADVWTPLVAHGAVLNVPSTFEDRAYPSLLLIGRLSRGGSRGLATATLEVITKRLSADFPGPRRPQGINVAAGTFFAIDPALKAIIALVMGTVALVLVIACANVANLMLARAASRQREIAIRIAVGAGRWRIVRQLLTETSVIGLTAGGAALLISDWVLSLLYRIGLAVTPFAWTVSLNLAPDLRVFAFTFVLALGAGVLFGLVPALQISSPRISAALHEDGTLLGLRMSRSRLRKILVIAQVAGCFVLLIDAGLLTRGLRTAQALDVGFRTHDVVYTEYDLRQLGYTQPRAVVFTTALQDRASRVPGVASVAFTSHVPLTGGVKHAQITFRGSPMRDSTSTIVSTISPQYFKVLGIPIVEGKSFTDGDSSDGVAIVSDGLARRFWPGKAPIGQTIQISAAPSPLTIIGVVHDASNAAIWRDKEMAVYLPVQATTDVRDLHLVVRTSGDTAAVAAALRDVAAELDPNLRFAATSLDRVLQLWILPSRVAAVGAAALGAIALILASLGIYAVLAFAVSHRTREIGIRMALGAEALDVVGLVIKDGGRLVAFGVVLGTLLSFATAPLLGRLLFGISAFDPLTYVLVTLLLGVIAAIACAVPALRAAALQPVVALRVE